MTRVHLNPPVHHPWMDSANCLDTDPDLFFATDTPSIRRAKTVCAGCPVSAQCARYAIDNSEQFGVFGGLTLEERRRVARKGAA